MYFGSAQNKARHPSLPWPWLSCTVKVSSHSMGHANADVEVCWITLSICSGVHVTNCDTLCISLTSDLHLYFNKKRFGTAVCLLLPHCFFSCSVHSFNRNIFQGVTGWCSHSRSRGSYGSGSIGSWEKPVKETHPNLHSLKKRHAPNTYCFSLRLATLGTSHSSAVLKYCLLLCSLCSPCVCRRSSYIIVAFGDCRK